MAKKKDFDGDPGGLIGDAIFSVIKPIYKEGEKAKRARRPSRRAYYYYAPEPKVSQKEIVFSVLGGRSETPAPTSALATSTMRPDRSPTPTAIGRRASG